LAAAAAASRRLPCRPFLTAEIFLSRAGKKKKKQEGQDRRPEDLTVSDGKKMRCQPIRRVLRSARY
jgi:hypothetical protein